jgi:NTE family protein
MDQARARRLIELIDDYEARNRKGTYWGLTTQINDYRLENHDHNAALVQNNQITQSLQDVGTRLWPFGRETQGRLINWGYALCDASMRRYVLTEVMHPGQLPVTDCPLED